MSGERDELRRLAEAATPGPWRWAGRDDGQVELVDHRFTRVITGARGTPCGYESLDGDWGLTADACEPCRAEAQKAHDPFVDYDGCENTVRNSGTVWLQDHEAHGIRPANTWAVREVPYRSDVVAVDHPDAAYIAAANPSAVLALLDEIDLLRGERDEWHRGLRDRFEEMLRQWENSRVSPNNVETLNAAISDVRAVLRRPSSPSPESSGERPDTAELRLIATDMLDVGGFSVDALLVREAADWIDACPAPASPSEGSGERRQPKIGTETVHRGLWRTTVKDKPASPSEGSEEAPADEWMTCSNGECLERVYVAGTTCVRCDANAICFRCDGAAPTPPSEGSVTVPPTDEKCARCGGKGYEPSPEGFARIGAPSCLACFGSGLAAADRGADK